MMFKKTSVMQSMLIIFVSCLLLFDESTVSDSYYGVDGQKLKSSCHDKELKFESEWLRQLPGYIDEFEYRIGYGSRGSTSAPWKEIILSGKLHYTATDAYCEKVSGGNCSLEARLAADRQCNTSEAPKLEDCIGLLEQSYNDRDYRSLSLIASGKGNFRRPADYRGEYYEVHAELVLADGCKLSWKDKISYHRCDDLDEYGVPEYGQCCDEFGPEDDKCWPENYPENDS